MRAKRAKTQRTADSPHPGRKHGGKHDEIDHGVGSYQATSAKARRTAPRQRGKTTNMKGTSTDV